MIQETEREDREKKDNLLGESMIFSLSLLARCHYPRCLVSVFVCVCVSHGSRKRGNLLSSSRQQSSSIVDEARPVLRITLTNCSLISFYFPSVSLWAGFLFLSPFSFFISLLMFPNAPTSSTIWSSFLCDLNEVNLNEEACRRPIRLSVYGVSVLRTDESTGRRFFPYSLRNRLHS